MSYLLHVVPKLARSCSPLCPPPPDGFLSLLSEHWAIWKIPAQKRKVTQRFWSCGARSHLCCLFCLSCWKTAPPPFCWEILSHFLLYSFLMSWGSEYGNGTDLWLEGFQFEGHSGNTVKLGAGRRVCIPDPGVTSCRPKLVSWGSGTCFINRAHRGTVTCPVTQLVPGYTRWGLWLSLSTEEGVCTWLGLGNGQIV